MSQNFPKFPDDFCIETFTTKASEYYEKRQHELVSQEMNRIYNLVMDNKGKNVTNVEIIFQFNSELNVVSRKYILEEILKRFPKVRYIDSTWDTIMYIIDDIIDDIIELDTEYIIYLS